MSKRINSHIIFGFLACTMAISTLGTTAAQAAPPVGLHGIDLAMVLHMQDNARRVHAKETLAKDWSKQEELKTFQHIKTIVIDPGHGGENQGALGVAHVHEKFLTMDLAYALRARLQKTYPKARIIMTRYWDTSMGLGERIHLANQVKADLFLSLHYNSATTKRAVGIETFYLSTKHATPNVKPTQGKPLASIGRSSTGMTTTQPKEPVQGTKADDMLNMKRDLMLQQQHQNSGLLARTVQRALISTLKSRNRGVKQANFGVLRGAHMPAVVVEAGFVSHPKEGKRVLKNAHRDRVVDALMVAIGRFDSLMAKKYTKPPAQK